MTTETHDQMREALDELIFAQKERRQVEDAARAIAAASEALHEILSPCCEGMPDDLYDALYAMRAWVDTERDRTREQLASADAHWKAKIAELEADKTDCHR
jgi:hypothetical protein